MPVRVTVTIDEPTVTVAGESVASIAGGWLRVTGIVCELPPPGAGFKTATLKVPADARSAAGADAVSSVALTKVVASRVVPAMTTEDELKFVPVRVNTVSGEPA